MTDNPKEENLIFSLDTNGIEVKALIKILQDTHLSFREIGNATAQTDVELKIYPFKQGSFVYDLAIATASANAAISAFTIFREILSYKKSKLDLERARLEIKPKKEKEITEEKKGRAILEANPIIEIYLDEMLRTISEKTDGFSIKEVGKESAVFKITSKEIKRVRQIEISYRRKNKPRRQTIDKPNEKVSLVRKSDKKYGMWEFIYEDVRIMAHVPDELKKGANFTTYRPGTQMRVYLTIRQEYNVLANAWENIGYKIQMILSLEKV